jgi:predicted component of type VI protein secretion system
MDYQLLVVRGRSTLGALALLDGVTTVGRHDSCHIRIKSSQVSRKHCELFEKKGILLVKDLGSANGTIVNGKKIEGQRVLEPGDELTLGPVTLRVAKIGQAPPIRTPAVPASADTAVVEAISAPVSDDEFEIDFDDEPTVTSAQPAGGADMDQSFEIPFDDGPAPGPPPAPAAVPSSTPSEPKRDKKSEIKKPAEPEPVVQGADEAIADFLLDIKLDEDD